MTDRKDSLSRAPARASRSAAQPPPGDRAVQVDQRIYLPRTELVEIEQRIRLERHVERYSLLRQFAKGVVCDAACGCGYGTYLLSTNPDVDLAIGVDADSSALEFAEREYRTERTQFSLGSLDAFTSPTKIDMLFSVETIEHLVDPTVLVDCVERNAINHVIVTYPSKKTTHYNRFHHHDFKVQDILDLFDGFTCYRHFNWREEFDVVFLLRSR